MHTLTQMLCPWVWRTEWTLFPFPLVFMRLCGCFGLASCWNLKAAVLMNTVSFLWSYGRGAINMLIRPVTQCLLIGKKGPWWQNYFGLTASMPLLDIGCLNPPQEKRGKKEEMKKKWERKWERWCESAESRNHVAWCLLAKVASLYCSWSAR